MLEYCHAFALDIAADDVHVTMRASLNNATFKLSKSDEDKLRAHHSFLVESKFDERWRRHHHHHQQQASDEQCLSEIISGMPLAEQRRSARYGIRRHEASEHELTTSFDADGYFTSDELAEFIALARRQLLNATSSGSSSVGGGLGASAGGSASRSIKAANATAGGGKAIKIASSLIKKAQQTKSKLGSEASDRRLVAG